MTAIADIASAKAGKGDKSFGFGLHKFMTVLLAILLISGVGGWAATAQLSGAVIAQGSVIVDENLKQIQHRDGGIVKDIFFREGDVVRSGQIMFTLDNVQTRAELSIVQAQLAELLMRRARLTAERDGAAFITFPAVSASGDLEIATVEAGETRLFEGNRTSRDSQQQQLELGIIQIGEEIQGLASQRVAKVREIELAEEEYGRVADLVSRGLLERTRHVTADRDRVRLQGELGEIDAAIARANARIGEIRLQIIAVGDTARTEAQRELSLLEPRIAELGDRLVAIGDRLARLEIRAPISGTINELNVFTQGGVVSPAETLATIVPSEARLVVEAQIPPASIDQVRFGSEATLRFPAFNQRTTPELNGEVVHVSPATSRDSATGATYYVALVEVPMEERERLGGAHLVPGMPVEVFVSTEERSALSYFLRPITDQFAKAFRER